MRLPFEGISPAMHPSVFVAPSADIIGDVTIGEDSSVWFNCVLRGDVHRIVIGKRCSIQDLSMLHVTHFTLPDKSDGSPTILGDDITVGHRVMLHGCTIEDGCLIGRGATI